MTERKTRDQLQAEVFQLSNICGNLAKENELLRVRVESGGIRALQDTIASLRGRVAELEEALANMEQNYAVLEEELSSAEKAEVELSEQVEKLEEACDPDTISTLVHDFLRTEGLLLAALDAPIGLAPTRYVTGLREAIQKAANE